MRIILKMSEYNENDRNNITDRLDQIRIGKSLFAIFADVILYFGLFDDNIPIYALSTINVTRISKLCSLTFGQKKAAINRPSATHFDEYVRYIGDNIRI